MDNAAIADVLDRAADLIEPEGAWGQGGLNPRIPGAHGCHCADTAIFEQALQDRQLRSEARKYFAHFLGVAGPFGVQKWNDQRSRTQAEVVSKLREAARLSRNEVEKG